jgi:CheY-like chemotaxis protein
MSHSLRIGGRKALILVVDDERDNRELVEVILEHDGFVIASAASGEEALASIANQRPDLIILDIMMPGMNGYEVTLKLKADAATRSIPVLIMSALDDRSARTLAASVGADAFFSKPMRRRDLCARVREYLTASVPLPT